MTCTFVNLHSTHCVKLHIIMQFAITDRHMLFVAVLDSLLSPFCPGTCFQLDSEQDTVSKWQTKTENCS